MKIAICTRNATHGGVESLIASHRNALLRRGDTVDVYVCGGVEQPVLTPFPYSYCASAASLRAHLLPSYDVVEYHWVANEYVQAIRHSGLPCVEVVHRTDTAECDKSVPHVIVAHSQFLADAISAQCGRPVAVVPNALDVSIFPDGNAPYDPAAAFGAITRYDPSKGMDLVLRAWALIQSEVSEVFGVRMYGEGIWSEYLRRMIAVLGLRNVDLCGPITRPELYLEQFGCIVHPSRMEGMPIAIQEALACNRPVITTALPGMVEFNAVARAELGHDVLTLVPPEDEVALSHAMLSMARGDIPHYETRSYIQAHYDIAPRLARMVGGYATARERAAQGVAEVEGLPAAPARAVSFTIQGQQPTLLVLGAESRYPCIALMRDMAELGWNVVVLYQQEREHVSWTNYLATTHVESSMVTRPLVVLVTDPAMAGQAVMLNPQGVIYASAGGHRDELAHRYLLQYADYTIAGCEHEYAGIEAAGGSALAEGIVANDLHRLLYNMLQTA